MSAEDLFDADLAEDALAPTPKPVSVSAEFAAWWKAHEEFLMTVHYDGSKWSGVFFLAQAAFKAGKAT